MRIYLAGRYSRRLELCGYREEIRAVGHTVDAVWLNGEHQISTTGEPIGEQGERLVEKSLRPGERLSPDNLTERAAKLRQKFARDDFRDVLACNLLIGFTEEPREGGRNRGGRHVEFGIALGMMKRVWIVGPRENIFCWLEEVRQFDSWQACLAELKNQEK